MPVQHQTYDYLPGRDDRYQIILLVTEAVFETEQLAKGYYLKVEQPGLEPTIF